MIYDMHIHTDEVSPCGKVAASELVRLYHLAGYQGLVITDHYYDGFFNRLGNISWQEKTSTFLSGYHAALAAAEPLGLQIFPGMELRFSSDANDYLVYGFSLSFLYEHPELYTLTLPQFRELISGTGIRIVQAHPFRPGITPAPPELLDGVEIWNGNKRHDSRNALAQTFAARHHLPGTAGSDFHQTEDLARCGVILRHPVTDIHGLLREVLSSRHDLYVNF